MKTKYFLVFLALLLSPAFNNKAYSQRCLVFRYDNDGNRIKRFVDNHCDEIKDCDEMLEIVDDDEVSVYPNPTNGLINITLRDRIIQEAVCCELYDVNGILILEQYLFEKETEIDIGNLPVGIYLLKVYSGIGVISTIILKQ